MFWNTRKPVRLQVGASPCVEVLEDRILLSTAPVRTIREASAIGGNPAAAIQATVDAFRADLGDPNNGNAVGSQGPGRRQITWDGGDNDAAPARLSNNFFNAVAPRGVIFNGDPRIQFQVSADATPAVPGTLEEFGNINPTYPTAFTTFSSPRLFTSLNNNVMEVEFVVPGTLDRATVSGFGAVFTDVDVAGSTKIEFFDIDGREIFERDVLAIQGNESLSFLGVTFVGAPIAKVRITAGQAAVGPNDVTQTPSGPDIVVMDDFIYGEPQPIRNPVVVLGSDPGVAARVQVINGGTGNTLADFNPYPGFFGGVRVATGDITGDGIDDIITAAGPTGGPHVKVFDGNTFNEISSFFAFAPGFLGGIFVAAGNINGDARIDIIVGADAGAGPHVKVINGAGGNQVLANGEINPTAHLANFFAFGPGFQGGVRVASADLNGDFLDDVIVGAGPGAGPHVKVINATQLNNVVPNGEINAAALLSSFFAYDPAFNGGVFVTPLDFDNDGRDDIATGPGAGSPPEVRFFNSLTAAELGRFFAFDPAVLTGVNVYGADLDLDGLDDLIALDGDEGIFGLSLVGDVFAQEFDFANIGSVALARNTPANT